MEPHRILTGTGLTTLEVSWSDQNLGIAVLRYPQAFALIETRDAEPLRVGTLVTATLPARGKIIATILPSSRPIWVTVEATGMTNAEADELIRILQSFGRLPSHSDGKS
ncbi:hypothetical protein P3W24_12105 [Luteibacter sp. PPL201]|uniref:PilZ domain-containing protein n=1 Tax=Luteibacter sahnii TaxID=3021977 RepID=A0ABT6BC56_9GAMM